MSTDEREAAYEARIARLTLLARRVRPEAEVSVYEAGAVVGTRSSGLFFELVRVSHPDRQRCLDALEAALLVLADEARIPLTADQVTRDALESCRRDREALTRRIREERAAVEGLAEEWDQRAEEAASTGAPSGVYRAGAISTCARELRERAKGGSRVRE